MVNVNPIVTIVGEVNSVNERQLTDPETAEVKDKVSIIVRTRKGFIEVTVPKSLRPLDRSEGDLVIFECEVLSWVYKGRTGTSFILETDATEQGMQVPLELAGAKK